MIDNGSIQIMSHIVIRDADTLETLLKQRDAIAKALKPVTKAEMTTEPQQPEQECSHD